MAGPSSIGIIDAEAFAATIPAGTDERRVFETLFIHHGSVNQNRLADREALLKLKRRDTAGGKPGMIARALIQFGV